MSKDWANQPHGHVTVESKGYTIYTTVEQGFNQAGIQRYEKLVYQHVPDSPWLLVDKVNPCAGLTPEAAMVLKRVFEGFIRQQCVAIVENAGPTFGRLLQQHILSDLSIPTLVSTRQEEVDAFLVKHSAVR